MEKLYVTSMYKQKGLRTISMTYCSGTRKTRKIRSPRSLGSHNSEGLRRRTAAAVVQVLARVNKERECRTAYTPVQTRGVGQG